MFDSVIADTRQLQQQAWRQLAQEENLPFPAEPRHLYDMRAERVITEVLAAHQPLSRGQPHTSRERLRLMVTLMAGMCTHSLLARLARWCTGSLGVRRRGHAGAHV